jgi:hypothetical protein
MMDAFGHAYAVCAAFYGVIRALGAVPAAAITVLRWDADASDACITGAYFSAG